MFPPAVRLGMTSDTAVLAFATGSGGIGSGAWLLGAVSTSIRTGIGGGDVGMPHLLCPSLFGLDLTNHGREIVSLHGVRIPLQHGVPGGLPVFPARLMKASDEIQAV